MAKLTVKQQRFCDEYLIDLNATQACIRAGYSKKTARQIGQENLTKPYIAEYIKKRLKEKEDALIADQDEVMRYLSAVMRREKTENVVVTLTKEHSEYITGEDGKQRKQTVKEDVAEVIEIPARLNDANKAAELLGRAYSIYTDRIDADIDMELNISVNYGDER